MTAHPPAPAAAPSDAEVAALIDLHESAAAKLQEGKVVLTEREKTAAALRSLLRDRRQHAAATAAAVQAALREAAAVCQHEITVRKECRKAANLALDRQYHAGQIIALDEAMTAILALTPTPSPERGEAQQQGGNHG